MSDPNADRFREMLFQAHDQLAAFARQNFQEVGRGVIQVAFPDVSNLGSDSVGVVSTGMTYITLKEIRRLTGGMKGETHEDADALIRMLETYDPSKQAVVYGAIGKGNPVSAKMRLDLPTLADEADGVH